MVDLQAAAAKEHVQVCVTHLLREDPVGYATHHSAALAHKRNTSMSAVQQQPAQRDNLTIVHNTCSGQSTTNHADVCCSAMVR